MATQGGAFVSAKKDRVPASGRANGLRGEAEHWCRECLARLASTVAAK